MRVVVVEDNTGLATALSVALSNAGHAVEIFADGLEAQEYLLGFGADLVVLDINLPSLSGFEILKALRAAGLSLPILILTARSEHSDRVSGLDGGADDYLVKPFVMDEFLARVRALARRRKRFAPVVEQVGPIRYNRSSGELQVDQNDVALSPRERALFELLLDRVGSVVTKSFILDTLYGVGTEVEANACELVVSRLRRKLGDRAPINTIRGLGYMLKC